MILENINQPSDIKKVDPHRMGHRKIKPLSLTWTHVSVQIHIVISIYKSYYTEQIVDCQRHYHQQKSTYKHSLILFPKFNVKYP